MSDTIIVPTTAARLRVGYRSIVWESDEPIDGTAVVGDQGLGKLNPTNFAGKFIGQKYVPMVAVSFVTTTSPATIDLAFRDPETGDKRKQMFADASGTITDFVEDNLGHGWPFPFADGASGRVLDLVLVTTVAEAQSFFVELWWEPIATLREDACHRGLDGGR